MTQLPSSQLNNSGTSLKCHEWNFRPLAIKAFIFYLLCLPFSLSGNADELFDSVQIHGFASQAMFLTSGNNMFGPSISNPNFDFTELGINGSWLPLPNLRLSMQILSRRAGNWDNGSPEIDFGLLDYSFDFNSDYRLGIRAGRVRQPYGLYNDTRDVAFTRPSILLPQSIYFEATRDFTISGDGLLLYGEMRKPWGNLTLELLGGYPRTNSKDTEYTFMGQITSGSLDPNPSFIGRLNYEAYDGSLRLALSGAYGNMEYKPNPVYDTIPRGNINFDPIVLSAQYNFEKWSFTSEYSYWFLTHSGFGYPYDSKENGESYYFQAAYRFAPKWELMARYDAFYLNTDDENGLKFQASGQGPAYSQFAKYWIVGLRYDITPWMMVRAEYDYVNGTALLPPQGLLNLQTGLPDYSKTTQYWDMFGFLVSFRF